jgi:hypothetical protein
MEKALVKQLARGELLNLSFEDLNEKQKNDLREKVLNEKLNLLNSLNIKLINVLLIVREIWQTPSKQ